MSKKLRFFVSMLFLVPYMAMAQTITGTIIDETGEPIPGVNIRAKGYPDVGTITDMNGDYSLSVPEDVTSLVFSFIGFKTREIQVGDKKLINVTMQEKVTEFKEIVVTATGEKRDKDKTSIISTNVKAAQLELTGSFGISSALVGKSPGLRITQTSGDPGAASNIQIRGGLFSALGNTQPLIVLDGIAISNAVLNSSSGNEVSPMSRLNDINPLDIESVEILRGAAAAALWGSQGINGVLVITTKRGLRGQPIKVTVSSQSTATVTNRLFPIQTSYSQGRKGVPDLSRGEMWGPSINDRSGEQDVVDFSEGYFVSNITGKFIYPILEKNSKETFLKKRKKQLFPTAYSQSQNISLEGGIGEKGTLFLNLSNRNQLGGYGKNHFNKQQQISINASYDISEKLTVTNSSRYVSTRSRGQISSNKNSIVSGYYGNAPDFDITDYIGTFYGTNGSLIKNTQRDFRNPTGNLSRNTQNPLFSINKERHEAKVNRFITRTDFKINLGDWISFTTRGGVDAYFDNREDFKPMFSAGDRDGSFSAQTINETIISLDEIIKINKTLGENYTVRGIVGYNITKRKQQNFSALSSTLIGNFETFNFNAIPEDELSFNFRKTFSGSNRLYYNLGFEAFSQVYMDFSGAFESSSRSFTSPPTLGIGLVWQFSKLPLFENSVLSFGKLLASYGTASSAPNPFAGVQHFRQNPYVNSIHLGSNDYPVFQNPFALSRTFASPKLKNRVREEWEFGVNFRLFKDRFDASINYYTNTITDDLMRVGLASETGFTNILLNAISLKNTGVEIALKYDFIKNQAMSARFFFNASTNKNVVTKTPGEGFDLRIAGHRDPVVSRVREGRPLAYLGIERGMGRDEDGNLILNDDGFPVWGGDNSRNIEIGSPHPDWIGSYGLNLSSKGVFVNILFDYAIGGKIFSATKSSLIKLGLDPITANTITLTEDVVDALGTIHLAGTTVRGNLRDFDGSGPAPTVLLNENWYSRREGYLDTETMVFDAGYIRLQELNIGYSFTPKKWGIEYIRLAATASNLALWTFDSDLDFDPQVNAFRSPSGDGIPVGISRGLEDFTTPTSTIIGLNLQLKF